MTSERAQYQYRPHRGVTLSLPMPSPSSSPVIQLFSHPTAALLSHLVFPMSLLFLLSIYFSLPLSYLSHMHTLSQAHYQTHAHTFTFMHNSHSQTYSMINWDQRQRWKNPHYWARPTEGQLPLVSLGKAHDEGDRGKKETSLHFSGAQLPFEDLWWLLPCFLSYGQNISGAISCHNQGCPPGSSGNPIILPLWNTWRGLRQVCIPGKEGHKLWGSRAGASPSYS